MLLKKCVLAAIDECFSSSIITWLTHERNAEYTAGLFEAGQQNKQSTQSPIKANYSLGKSWIEGVLVKL